tara:strand:- start:345 stop:599 length:255 start_codon:yes stop_codon:yes gene_type:complete
MGGVVKKIISPSKPKAAPAPKPAPEPKKIAGRDAAAEAAAARRRARRGRAGGLMAASDVVADVAGTGLPALGETGLGIDKTKLG